MYDVKLTRLIYTFVPHASAHNRFIISLSLLSVSYLCRFSILPRYHNSKMVNYDVHNGFSVSSIFLQSEDHFISNTNSHREHELQQQQLQQSRHIANGGSGSTTGGGSDGRTINQNSTLNRNTTVSKSKNPFLVTPSISILTIKQVNFLHVGNYTCAPSNAKQASITVHVLRGNFTFINNRRLPTPPLTTDLLSSTDERTKETEIESENVPACYRHLSPIIAYEQTILYLRQYSCPSVHPPPQFHHTLPHTLSLSISTYLSYFLLVFFSFFLSYSLFGFIYYYCRFVLKLKWWRATPHSHWHFAPSFQSTARQQTNKLEKKLEKQ